MWIKKKDYSHIFLSFLYVIIQIHCVFLFVVVLKKPRILQEVIKKLLKTTEIENSVIKNCENGKH